MEEDGERFPLSSQLASIMVKTDYGHSARIYEVTLPAFCQVSVKLVIQLLKYEVVLRWNGEQIDVSIIL